MSRFTRVALLVGLAGGVVATVAVKGGQSAGAVERAPAVRGRPHLVDVGAGKCIPCKAMAPILEELRAEYAGRLQVTFVDVWVNPEAGQPYAIRMIPTQIFYGADGRELARHEGFMSKADILARWKALGVEL